ncbi:MAG: nucleotidyltransferase domain-containing protein [Nitrososphaerota archaeon]|nr:nucleotidyltransferase domain-containing protein [Candidatus Geocrenenecus dongiae]
MSREFDLYIESGRKRIEQLKNYDVVAREVKNIVQKILGEVDVYVFGSVVEGKITASSDIDILIIVDDVSREEAYRIKTMIYQSIDAPIELHVISSSEFENWYKKFVGKLKRID